LLERLRVGDAVPAKQIKKLDKVMTPSIANRGEGEDRF
jgi:hypothetical protein